MRPLWFQITNREKPCDSNIPNYGQFAWEREDDGKALTMIGHGYYISCAIFCIMCLVQFFFNNYQDDPSKFVFSEYYEEAYGLKLTVIRNPYQANFYASFGFYGQEKLGAPYNDDGTYRIETIQDINFLIEAMTKKNDHDDLVIEGRTCVAFYCVDEKELVTEFLGFFELAIKDVPQGSRIFELNYIKETMSNFQKLKAYAKEKGWVE